MAVIKSTNVEILCGYYLHQAGYEIAIKKAATEAFEGRYEAEEIAVIIDTIKKF